MVKSLNKLAALPKISVSPISAHQSDLERIALWHHREWMKGRDPVDTVEEARHLQKRVFTLQQHLGKESIPTTFIASVGEEPVASISLVHYQFTPNQLRSEWLTNIFVAPSYRGQGIARKIIDHACRFADANDVKHLRLYTTDKGAFYRHLGWNYSGKAFIQGEDVEIYSRPSNLLK
jgi:GNAT superfamily N-acetyltransferase